MTVLYEAPARNENFAGPRDFAYLAEIDILGWKFRTMQDGSFVIDTPRTTRDMVGESMMCSLGPTHRVLLRSLIEIPSASRSVTEVGRNVGRFA